MNNKMSKDQVFILENLNTEEGQEANRRLSFCDMEGADIHPSPITSPAQPDEHFEFLITSSQTPRRSMISSPNHHNDIIFCGKIVNEQEEEELNEYQKRDYFSTIRSQSSRKPDNAHHESVVQNRSIRITSSSTRFLGKDQLDYHVQRVNLSSLTSMSSKSKRRMFMFGPVKFKPEMEMSAIKQRQHAVQREKSQKTVTVNGGKSNYFTSVLARSLGCIPAAAMLRGVHG